MHRRRPYLAFHSITKVFPGVKALDAVSFGVSEGSVHGLIGENGAGKSTLLKVLSGVHAVDDGEVVVDGTPRRFKGTAEALEAGIAIIYQELNLVPEMTVAENLFLGHFPEWRGLLCKRRMNSVASELLHGLGEVIDPGRKVSGLPIAQRQMVEIGKALTRGAKILAFDEPTSSLSEREVKNLFEVICGLKARGHVILYVSHRMEEIFSVCDSVTVLRDGRHIETYGSMEEVSQGLLIRHMVGRDLEDVYHFRPRERGVEALAVEDLEGPGLAGPVSLSVAAGEVLGVFGLVGAGRSELLRLLYGAVPPFRGHVRRAGQPVFFRHPQDAIRAGVVLCPEDRQEEAIFPHRSIQENINLSARRRHARWRTILHARWERDNANQQIRTMGIRTPSFRQPIRHLSGGNQQKAVLGRWLSEQVGVLLLDEPTRGIDIGAKAELYRIIMDLAGRGVAIVMVSSELPEVLGISDRILVMRKGVLVGEMMRKVATPEGILELALPGISQDSPAGLLGS